MMLLTVAWTLMTAVGASDVILQQDHSGALYPKLLSNETVHCVYGSVQWDSVFWFRFLRNGEVQFLGKFNKAEVSNHGDGVDQERFRFKSKTKSSFMLTIMNVKEEDTGIYSCVVRDRSYTETWKSGVLLLPGVPEPTSPPTTTTRAPDRTVCRCSSGGRCGSLVLWPLVGIVAALALTLTCTLYYFSRLPKKCQHRFVKKRTMT